MNAVLYLRVSSGGQVDGDGFERQRQACLAYARVRGMKVVGEYRDEGVSGKTELEHRTGLAALLAEVEADSIDVVLVERADRLARGLVVGEIILSQFSEAGVSVIEVDGGNDLTAGEDDPTRTLIRQVLGAVAQYDKTVTVLKMRAARERMRAKTGRCEGRKPFGDRPGEAATLERISVLRHGRRPLGAKRIADVLNLEGHKTREGRPWKAGTISKMLKRLKA